MAGSSRRACSSAEPRNSAPRAGGATRSRPRHFRTRSRRRQPCSVRASSSRVRRRSSAKPANNSGFRASSRPQHLDRDIAIPHGRASFHQLSQTPADSLDLARLEPRPKHPQLPGQAPDRHPQVVDGFGVLAFARALFEHLAPQHGVQPVQPPGGLRPDDFSQGGRVSHRLTRTTSGTPYASRKTPATCSTCHCSISTSRSENSRSSTAFSSTAVSTRSTRCSWL